MKKKFSHLLAYLILLIFIPLMYYIAKATGSRGINSNYIRIHF